MGKDGELEARTVFRQTVTEPGDASEEAWETQLRALDALLRVSCSRALFSDDPALPASIIIVASSPGVQRHQSLVCNHALVT